MVHPVSNEIKTFGNIYSDAWSKASSFVAKPIAAGAAIVIPYRLFAQKTELQITGQFLQVPYIEGVRNGIRTAPTLFLLIGSQMIAESFIEKRIHKVFCKKEGVPISFSTMALSSALVGFFTVHPMAVFAGHTCTPRRGCIESMRLVTPIQALATAWMESWFIMGLRGSKPLCDRVKILFGEDRYGFGTHTCSFISGFIGSVLGHPGDTVLTRFQKKLPVSVSQLMKGTIRRGVGVGIYAVIYHAICDKIETSH